MKTENFKRTEFLVFPSGFKKTTTLEFVGVKENYEYKKKDGTIFKIDYAFIFIGSFEGMNGKEYTGDIVIPYRCLNLDAVNAKFGHDTDLWKPFICNATRVGNTLVIDFNGL